MLKDKSMEITIIDGRHRWSKLLQDILQLNGYTVHIVSSPEIPFRKMELYICSYEFIQKNSTLLKNTQHKENVIFALENWENVPSHILARALEISYPLNTHRILKQIDRTIQQILQNESLDIEYVGNSQFARELRKKLEIISNTDATILITGESGTGKDVVSQIIHKKSQRREKQLLKINCASIPATLLESELFGYKKGAFTGAEMDYPGRLLKASGGTLFLDEIGELQIDLQAKLLRVLEEKVVTPIGGNEHTSIDIRYIFATNKNIMEEVNNKKFREDLFYRINTIEIRLLPLREHKEDIPFLIDHFIHLYNRKYNKNFEGMKINDLLHLYTYDWPGNIRELQHFVERLIIYSDGNTYPNVNKLLEGLDSIVEPDQKNSSFYKEAMKKYEMYLITSYLIKNSWNIVKTAKDMGIERTNLYKKMKKLQIEPKQYTHQIK